MYPVKNQHNLKTRQEDNKKSMT